MWNLKNQNDYCVVLRAFPLISLPIERKPYFDKRSDLFRKFYKQLYAILYLLYNDVIESKWKRTLNRNIHEIIQSVSISMQ